MIPLRWGDCCGRFGGFVRQIHVLAKLLELVEGAIEGAAVGGLVAGEGVELAGGCVLSGGVAEGMVWIRVRRLGVELVEPIGFDLLGTAHLPGGGDQEVEGDGLGGGGAAEIVEKGLAELGEFGGVAIEGGDVSGIGAEPVFAGVLGGAGFAGRGAGSGGTGGVAAVGFEFALGNRHGSSYF
ncbi:MAG: hypothetical protein U0Q16_16030 [Bryobacteraceae bacterium]